MLKVHSISSTAIVDVCITKSAKFVVAVIPCNDNEMVYEIFETCEDMDKKAHDAISSAISSMQGIETVVTDCCIGYLPKVMRLFKEKNINQVFAKPTHKMIAKVESKMHKLSNLQ